MDEENLDLFEFLDVSSELLLELEEAVCKIEIGKNFEENYAITQESLDIIRKGAKILNYSSLSPIIDHLRSLIFKRKELKAFTPEFTEYLLSSSIYLREIFTEGGTQIRFSYQEPDKPDEPLLHYNSSPPPISFKDIQDCIPKYNFAAIFDKLKQTSSEEDFREVMREYFIKRNPLIVVIDDDPNIADALESILEASLKIRMTHFLSGEEALEKLTSISPDLIFVDFNMPHMSGIEFIQKSRKKLMNIPIIFFTGLLDKNICLEALSCGADAIIEKPFSNEKIINIVEHSLNKYGNFKNLINIINSLFYHFNGTQKELEKNGTYKLLFNQINKLLEVKDLIKRGELKFNINV